MKLQPITASQAEKLEKLGFEYQVGNVSKENNGGNLTLSITVQLALKWLRDEKAIYCEVQLDQTKNPKFAIEATKYVDFCDFEKIPTIDKEHGWVLYRTYEEAESAVLDHALDFLLRESTENI